MKKNDKSVLNSEILPKMNIVKYIILLVLKLY